MSFRTSVALPAPVNGTSQQAPHLRSPQHAGGLTNAWPDIATGVSKRPGTDFDRKFSDQPKLSAKLKKLQYGDESYSVVYNLDSTVPVRVFRDGGNEASVSISSDALAYMTSGSGVCRLFPLGDFAAIVNPDVATAVADGPSYSLERARPEYRDLIALSRAQSGVAGDYRVSKWSLSLPVNGKAPSLMDVTMMSRQVAR